jgi:glycerophosphoryl diester phosphodiesterase
VCAHGGDTTHHPPNTREAFQAALVAGADCAEVDVSATSDRHLINLHARELEELLQKKGVQVRTACTCAVGA